MRYFTGALLKRAWPPRGADDGVMRWAAAVAAAGGRDLARATGDRQMAALLGNRPECNFAVEQPDCPFTITQLAVRLDMLERSIGTVGGSATTQAPPMVGGAQRAAAGEAVNLSTASVDSE